MSRINRMSRGLRLTLIIAALAVGAGIVAGGIGYVLGGMQTVSVWPDGIKVLEKTESGEWVKVDEAYAPADVKEIEVELDFVEKVNIVKGETLSVKGENQKGSGGLAAKVEGGVLKVVPSEKERRNYLLFGGFSNFNSAENKSEVTITVPAGVEFSKVKASLAFGKLSVTGVNAGLLDINSDSGDVKVSQITGKTVSIHSSFGEVRAGGINADTLKIKSDTGNTEVADLKLTGELKIENSFGDIKVSGLLGQKSEIESDSGEVELRLENDPATLHYNLSTEAGTVKVDGAGKGSSYSSKGSTTKGTLRVNSDFGGIQLDFKMQLI